MKPKTWEQLKDAGYVVELTEEQIAIARDLFRPQPRPLVLDPAEQSRLNHENEARLRSLPRNRKVGV